jgi:hypothetical protein
VRVSVPDRNYAGGLVTLRDALQCRQRQDHCGHWRIQRDPRIVGLLLVFQPDHLAFEVACQELRKRIPDRDHRKRPNRRRGGILRRYQEWNLCGEQAGPPEIGRGHVGAGGEHRGGAECKRDGDDSSDGDEYHG